MWNHRNNESISQYIAELRGLIQYRGYDKSLEHMLRDRLVYDVNHDRNQDHDCNCAKTQILPYKKL